VEAKNVAAGQLPATLRQITSHRNDLHAPRKVRRSWRPDGLGLTMLIEASEADDERRE
jgi:hypothetical protein